MFFNAGLPVPTVRASEVPAKIRVTPGEKTAPVYIGSARGMPIQNTAPNTANMSLTSFRTQRSTGEVIRALVKISPDLSQAVVTKIGTAISDTFVAYATDPSGNVNRQATELLLNLITRWNSSSYDYTRFTRSTDLRTLSESLLLDDIRYGAMAGELVLDRGRLPSYIKHFPSRLVKWQERGGAAVPYYTHNGEDKSLDFPTFVYISSLQDGETAYPDSQIEAAIHPVLFEEEFKEDLRRAIRNVILPRIKIVIKTEQWRKSLPINVQMDEKLLRDNMQATINELEDRLNSLNPEDALVVFDILDPTYMTHGNISTDRDIRVLRELLSGNVASGAKTLPAVLGKSETQGAGSAESMIFMKGVEAVQERLNVFFSRALTVAVRLFGFDVNVTFAFADVNLRPKAELEAFFAMRQSRMLQLLSLGFVSDERAAIELTGHLPPPTFKPLSGTGFQSAPLETSSNPYSNTSVKPGNVNDTTDGKNRKSDAPTGAKSQ